MRSTQRRQDSTSRRDDRRHALLWIGLLLLGVSIASAATAESPDRWIVRGHALGLLGVDDQVEISRPSGGPFTDLQASHRIDGGNGLGLGLEFLVNRCFGVEVTALFAEVDNDFSIRAGDLIFEDRVSASIEIFTAGVNYHFRCASRIDLYAGVFVGMSKMEDVSFASEGGRDKLSFDDDIGFGVNLGVDVPFKGESGWHFTAGVRYMATILESENPGEDLDLNPLIPSIGLSYRF